jgi:Superinfection immunity protein
MNQLFFAAAAGYDSGDFAMAMAFLLGGIIFVLSYFAPTFIAKNRKHRYLESIFMVNLFLGWTLIGWVVAIAWACMATPISSVQQRRRRIDGELYEDKPPEWLQ